MLVQALLLCTLLGADAAAAPRYDRDPFSDADFVALPLILNVSHPTRGRAELALFAATSVVDKYNAHVGGLLEASLHVSETLGLGVAFGFFHGAPTSIVTDPTGILGNRMQTCLGQGACGDITPRVPDYSEITGVADMLAFWSPLYGKVNFFSELDMALQLYAIVGGGINGTRTVTAQAVDGAQSVNDYRLQNGGFLAGGAFGNTKTHGTFGGGIRLFIAESLALRFEVRSLVFRDTFTFNAARGPEQYWSAHWFSQGGIAWNFF